MLRFKYDELMDRYSATNKTTGDHYVIVKRTSGAVYTYLNGELVDNRAKTVKEAKQNVCQYMEVA